MTADATRPEQGRRRSSRRQGVAGHGLTHQISAIVLIDESNRAIGTAEKEFVHKHGLLHRAFSIFLTDPQGRFLLQRRSRGKYHSGGLWSNSCCGHPRPGEKVAVAAKRRMFEELGIATDLTFRFFARYSTALDNGMHENELVYVYSGSVRSKPAPNPDEIEEIQHLSPNDVERLIRVHPQDVSYWMKHYFSVHSSAVREMSASGRSRLGAPPTQANFT